MTSARSQAWLYGFLAVAVAAFAMRTSAQTLTFTEVAAASGIVESDFGYAVAWGDYDGDQDLDAVVTDAFSPVHLWLNDGGGSFTDGAAAAGLGAVDQTDGVTCGDYDADGDLDLYFPRRDDSSLPDVLMQNDGTGFFTDVTAAVGIAQAGPNRTAAWVDYDADGDLDLFVTPDDEVGGGASATLYAYSGGVFVDVSAATGVSSMMDVRGPCFFDMDGDLDLDLALGSKQGPHLFRNDAGVFTDITVAAGLGGFSGLSVYTGSTSDYDNDGDMDLFMPTWDMTSAGLLLRNDGGLFTDVASASGILAPANQQDASWADVDQDGDEDLFVTGFRDPTTKVGLRDLLYKNLGNGLFVDVALISGISDASNGVGASWADYDGDGDLDLYVVNAFFEQDFLYRNDSTGLGGVVDVRAMTDNDGDGTSNVIAIRDALGARVEVDLDGDGDFAPGVGSYTSSFVDGGSGWGQQPGTRHIGVGSATTVDIRVTFPDGSQEILCGVSEGSTQTVIDPGLSIPAIASVTPQLLPYDGDPAFSTVTITGGNFLSPIASDVRVGGVSATSFTVDSDCQITAVLPPAPCVSGLCNCILDLEVVNADGTGTSVGAITYTEKPFVTGIVPGGILECGSGPSGVTVTGKNFLVDPSSTSASVDGVPLTGQVILDDNTIIGQLPAFPVTGAKDVTVSNTCGQAGIGGGFKVYPVLTGAAQANIGSMYNLQFEGRPGDLFLAYFSFLFDPTGIVLPPLCGLLQLRASFLYTIGGGTVPGSTLATVPFPIPANPGLVGTSLYFQSAEVQFTPQLAGSWSQVVQTVVIP